ncbi:TetR/AcrR family transcriptional regulator [Streptosporangiaceae bacterium NEAU-GS5]|nr:TetR/AcrR family transcriptional regulator [Streptosporangiaceae bacterium NEAU-GS5]
MNAGRTARERVRAEMIREITDIGRRLLATEGATGLSLRAIAREMGMVSSAVHRYFPTKDDLLTALIIDAFNAVGDTADAADAALPRDDLLGRWMAVTLAIRAWAVAHPHEYALIHGSPVPGYQAPEDTVVAASRDGAVLAAIVRDAAEAGVLGPMQGFPPPPAAFAADAVNIRAAIFGGVDDDVILRSLIAWTWAYGAISFELFGMFNNVITDCAAAFEHGARSMARYVGLSG